MADDAARRRALQFAQDLREIREANGISIEDVHHESKIPLGLIESFEESGLLDHVIFNRVYLRSFVRTYADVLGISADLALQSLEAALDGTYDRRLAVEYLGFDHLKVPDIGPGGVLEGVRGDDELEVRPEPPSDLVIPDRPLPVRRTRGPVRRPEPATPPVEASLGASPELDWTSQSPPPSTYAVRSRGGKAGGGQWVYPVIGLAVLGLIVWAVVNLTRSPGGEAPAPIAETTETAPFDTLDEGAAPEAPAPIVLGDTMRVTITAANDKVEDIKVKVDDDLRRPYWLDLGESRTFLPTREIVIERQLENISLTVEGRAYPTDRIDEEGRLVIDRESARQILSGGQ